MVKAIFGDNGGGKLLNIIHGCIIPQEQTFCFYLQKGVMYFETTTYSGHEGTNHAIKSGSSFVLLQHAIDKSAKIQLDTDCNMFDLLARKSNLENLAYCKRYYSPCRIHVEICNL